MEPSDVYIDPADVNITRFIDQITRIIPFKTKIVCEPKADQKYLVVSAASILAKVRRDRYIEELREKYGDFNSGYCSDVKTISWLKNWIMEHDDFPFFVRKSWKTIKKLLNG
jgi:ribonuclease HII